MSNPGFAPASRSGRAGVQLQRDGIEKSWGDRSGAVAFGSGGRNGRDADGGAGFLQRHARKSARPAGDGGGDQPHGRDHAPAGRRPRVGQLEFPRDKLGQVPWWAWFGGALGAMSLLSQPLAAPRLGAAMYIGLFVTASSVASVVVDHFGWLGFEQHQAGIGRIAGCALMVIGIALVSLF